MYPIFLCRDIFYFRTDVDRIRVNMVAGIHCELTGEETRMFCDERVKMMECDLQQVEALSNIHEQPVQLCVHGQRFTVQ